MQALLSSHIWERTLTFEGLHLVVCEQSAFIQIDSRVLALAIDIALYIVLKLRVFIVAEVKHIVDLDLLIMLAFNFLLKLLGYHLGLELDVGGLFLLPLLQERLFLLLELLLSEESLRDQSVVVFSEVFFQHSKLLLTLLLEDILGRDQILFFRA